MCLVKYFGVMVSQILKYFQYIYKDLFLEIVIDIHNQVQ